MAFDLMTFQTNAVARLQTMFASGTKRALLQSATGSGKTVMAGAFLRHYLDQDPNHRVLALVNLQALLGQIHDTMREFGEKISVLHDEVKKNKDGVPFELDYQRRMLLTMPTTFLNTRAGKNKLKWDENFVPTLILIDEAHKGTSEEFQIIRDLFPDALVLGLTATPFRAKNDSGECLVEWYGENLVVTVSVRELIEMGRLVQPNYIMLKDPEAHVVNTWFAVTQGSDNKRTIVFTRDTRHSVAVQAAFEQAGVSARIITAGSDTEDFYYTQQTPLQRQAIYNDFEAGHVDVLISVNALCEGFDSQAAKFCFLNRNVSNHALYHQMIGRVLRSFPGKLSCTIVDFHDNVKNHGPIEDYQWSIEAAANDNAFVERGTTMKSSTFFRKSAVYHACASCNHVYDIKKTKACHHCGFAHDVKLVIEVSELMGEINIQTKKDYEAFMMRFKPALDNEMYQGLVNKNFFPVFEGGKLKDEYAHLANFVDMDFRDEYKVAA